VASETPVESGAASWRNLFAKRAAIRGEHLAWGELQNRWHMTHGKRVPRHLCAGCRWPIAGAALDLIDGCRVHDTDDHACLIHYGERWRTAATRALVAFGLTPPEDR
jgi:hypothetical protein